MVDGVEALGSGGRIGGCHSPQESQGVVSKFAVGGHDKRVEVRGVVVFSSFVLFASECGIFRGWWLVCVDGLGGAWRGDADIDVPYLCILRGDDVNNAFLVRPVVFDAVE